MKYAGDKENTESLLNYTKSLPFTVYLAYGFNADTSETIENSKLVNEWL